MSRFEKPRIRPKAMDLGVYDLFEIDSRAFLPKLEQCPCTGKKRPKKGLKQPVAPFFETKIRQKCSKPSENILQGWLQLIPRTFGLSLNVAPAQAKNAPRKPPVAPFLEALISPNCPKFQKSLSQDGFN